MLATNAAVDGKINEVKSEVTTITNLATNSALSSKLNDVNGKTLSIANVATADALTFVENKVPNVIDSVKKADYDAKKQKLKKIILITTSDYNEFTNNILDIKIKEEKLVNDFDIAVFLKKTGFDDKLKKVNKQVTSDKIKHAVVQNELKDTNLWLKSFYQSK